MSLTSRCSLTNCLVCLLLLGVSAIHISGAPPYLRFLGAENGGLYAVGADGSLTLFRHTPETAAPAWLPAEEVAPAAGGWESLEHVLYNGGGILYGVPLAGSITYYADIEAGGIHAWGAGTLNTISLTNNWAEYRWLLGDGDGVIYAITRSGDLSYFRHGGGPDTNWVAAGGSILGSGWKYRQVIAGRNGVLYGIDYEGMIHYNRDLARDGSVRWEYPTNLVIGAGWDRFHHVVSTGNGHLYGIDQNGAVYYHHVSVVGGAADWSGSDPENPINPGEPVPPVLHRGLYCWPLSGQTGETINFMASCDGPSVLRFVRLVGTNAPDPLEIEMGRIEFAGSVQPVWQPPARHGCGWKSSHTLTIPANWPSGTYAARCSPQGAPDTLDSHEIPFIVKPSSNALPAKVAVVANVNTWNTYNDQWGGSHYSRNRANLSFLRPINPAIGSARTGLFHLLAGELWVQGWLSTIGGGLFQPAVITDLDLHNGFDLRGYCCVVLSTHPEYWTDEMYRRLRDYLDGGGSLLYLGGNGIYERVAYSADQTTLILDGGVDLRDVSLHSPSFLFRTADAPSMNERDLLGVATAHCGVLGGGYTVIRPAHPFLRGVVPDRNGRIGDVIGMATGSRGLNMNGKAAGLETDNVASASLIIGGECATFSGPADPGRPVDTGVPLNPLPYGHVVLAKAFAADLGGDAEMTYFPHAGGGFVLSVGSVTFGGCLFADPNLATLVHNALIEACLPSSRITSFTVKGANHFLLRLRGRPGSPLTIQRTDSLRTPWFPVSSVQMTPEEDSASAELGDFSPAAFFRLMPGPF